MAAQRAGLSTSPHGVVRIFYSLNVQPVIAEPAFVVPAGTVAIKTQDQNVDGRVDNVMAMIKQPSASLPRSHDWLFERYFADGTLDASGGSSLAFCAVCHNAFGATDGLGGTTVSD